VFAGKIPLVNVPPELRRMGIDALQLAINGGEDYELLFTVPQRMAGRLPRQVEGIPITVIGEITREKGMTVVDAAGHGKAMRPGGWDPFRG